jgi:hypothetical protein
LLRTERDRADHRVLELAHVARPIERLERFDRRVRPAHRAARRVLREKVFGEQRHVARAIAERRQPNLDDAEAVVEVLSKAAGRDKPMSDSAGKTALCAQVTAHGPPTYHPAWMIQHGMMMFNPNTEPPLVAGFDPASAWTQAINEYLHCDEPAAPPSGR